MTFRPWPAFKLFMWGLFLLASIAWAIDVVAALANGASFEGWKLFKGIVFGALSVMNISWALRELKVSNA